MKSAFISAIVFAAVLGKGQAIFTSIPANLPGDVLSSGIEAGSFQEVSEGITLPEHTSRQLTNIKVVLSSFACTGGKWSIPMGSPDACITTPGATFSQPVKLSIYEANGSSKGRLLASKVQTFQIPYRPSSDAAHCAEGGPAGGDGKGWYSVTDDACYHGVATAINFDLSDLRIALPQRVVLAVTYGTTHSGYSPMGESRPCFSSIAGCPYDLLNIGTAGNPLVGSNVTPTGVHLQIEVDTAASLNAVSVTPKTGSGPGPQTFSAVYTDANGASDLQVVYLAFGSTLGVAHSCFVTYIQSSNALFLFNDANSATLGPVTPGSSKTVANGQCSLSGGGGPVVKAGNKLTVPFQVKFAATFRNPLNILGLAQSYSGSQGNGSQLLGSWGADQSTQRREGLGSQATVDAVSVAPIKIIGHGPHTLTAVYYDAKGASDLQVVYLNVAPKPEAKHSCFALYIQASDALYLYNDTNSATIGPITPGSEQFVSNGQCTLSGAGGKVTKTDTKLSVPFRISLGDAALNSKTIFGLAQSFSGSQGKGWEMLGILSTVYYRPPSLSFDSPEFIFMFLPVVLVGYYVCFYLRNTAAAFPFLLICSLVFIVYSGLAGLITFAVLLCWNYTAIWFLTTTKRERNKWIFRVACAGNLVFLALFKYHQYLWADFEQRVPFLVLPWDRTLPGSVIPPVIGISYYTFQQIGYLVDTYRGDAGRPSFRNYALWVSLFVKIPAGPILRHDEVLPQFRRALPGIIHADIGASFLLLGLFKKLVLADALTPISAALFPASGSVIKPDLLLSWTGTAAYAAELYFDFSGYSDIAIGLGILLGLNLPFNFNSPYKAASMIEFWRRWHITLTRFFTEYVFFSLPGTRSVPIMRYCNLVIIMVLCGWWHGVTWNFLIWGACHGVMLAVNHLWRSVRKSLNLPAGRWWTTCSARVLTLGSVLAAWGIFAATSLQQTRSVFSGLLGLQGLELPPWLLPASPSLAAFLTAHGIQFNGLFGSFVGPYGATPVDPGFSNEQTFCLVLALMAISMWGPNTQEWLGWSPKTGRQPLSRPLWMRRSTGWAMAMGLLLFVLIKFLITTSPTPFLYGRF